MTRPMRGRGDDWTDARLPPHPGPAGHAGELADVAIQPLGVSPRARDRAVGGHPVRPDEGRGLPIVASRFRRPADRHRRRDKPVTRRVPGRDRHGRPRHRQARADRLRVLRQRDDRRDPAHPHVGVQVAAGLAGRHRGRPGRPGAGAPGDGVHSRSRGDGLSRRHHPPASRHARRHRLRRGLPGNLGRNHRLSEGRELEPAGLGRAALGFAIVLPAR